MKNIGQFAGSQLPRRITARLAGLGAAPGALVWQPAPPVTGDAARARHLVNGVLLFDGRLVETTEPLPWALTPPDKTWEAALHGHAWLDDAAAAKDPLHWEHLSNWVWAWLDRYGNGTGPGWEPEIAARRLTRWIAHSVRLLTRQPPERSALFFASLGMQARYVEWRWRETRDGAPRIEALAGLVFARLSLEGSGTAAEQAIEDLGREAGRIVDADGGIASRSPAELARVVALLSWSLSSIEDAGLKPMEEHCAALHRAAATTQALRHPSGALAQFHGGRSGVDVSPKEEARLVQQRIAETVDAPMGYYQVKAGASFLILDGAQSPKEPHTLTAHASALAFEFSHGPQQIVINSGPGQGFGNHAGHSARRTAAHSGIELGDRCTGRLTEVKGDPAAARLTTEGTVSARTKSDDDGSWLLADSTLNEAWFGLRVERRLNLTPDGLRLNGEDTALATRAETRAQMAKAFPQGGPVCPLRMRLHIHPSVRVSWALNGRAVALTLPDGTIWMFTADTDDVALQPSRCFDETRSAPRATQQIVATAPVLEYWGRITWTLERLLDGTSPLQARDQATY